MNEMKTSTAPTIEIELNISLGQLEKVQRLARSSGRSPEDIIADALGHYFAGMPELCEAESVSPL